MIETSCARASDKTAAATNRSVTNVKISSKVTEIFVCSEEKTMEKELKKDKIQTSWRSTHSI